MQDRTDSQLDVTGVCCPLPLMQIAKVCQGMSPGQTLTITGNDPLFEATIRDFCCTNGHTLLSIQEDEGRSKTIVIRMGVGSGHG
jgi:tRNA 2-thiouridine synthesizing protein A